MKIFFNASLTGKKYFLKEYKLIFDELKKSKYQLIDTPIFKSSVEKVTSESAEDAEMYFRKLQGWIRQADIVVFEASYPSLGIGHEIAMALDYEKPVIVLYLPDKKPYILEGVKSDKLQLIEYSDDSLSDLLATSLDYATYQQDTRFNFFISPRIGNYLDFVSKKKRVPRAVYLRRLIEEDMKKNKEFES